MQDAQCHGCDGSCREVMVSVEVAMVGARLDCLDRQYTDQPSGENLMNRKIRDWDI